MNFSLYLYKNLINGKVYVGYSNDLERRDAQHSKGSDRKTMPIDRALVKYGRNNFSLDVINILDNLIEAQQEEIYWIARMREFLGKENVYNISDGGFSGRPGIAPWNKGKKAPYSAETLAKMSESQSKRKWNNHQHIVMKERMTGEKNPFYGKSNKGSISQVKGLTWKVINGKRVWLPKPDKGGY